MGFQNIQQKKHLNQIYAFVMENYKILYEILNFFCRNGGE